MSLILNGPELSLLAQAPSSARALPPARVHEPTLEWRFISTTGEMLDEGTIDDPRNQTAEYDESGPALATALGTTGVFDLTLPNQSGTLYLRVPPASGTKPLDLPSLDEAWNIFLDRVGASTPAEGKDAVPVALPVDCEAFSLLIVGEGYTAGEEPKFDADIDRILGTLKQSSGYSEVMNAFSVHKMFFVSAESGVSDAVNGVVKDTALRIERQPTPGSSPRNLGFRNDVNPATLARVEGAAKAVHADVTFYLVNSSIYAGCASGDGKRVFLTTDSTGDPGLITAHELGHSLFGLEDEYSDGTCNTTAYEPIGPNVSVGTQFPWAAKMTPGVSVPTTGTDPSVIGAYEGGLYCTAGVYHSQYGCRMNELKDDFCAVCHDHILETVGARTAACRAETPCSHSECETGGALGKSCSPCTANTCVQRPSCCEPGGAWDETCIELAKSASSGCHGICATDDSSWCSHDECKAGEAMSPECSQCAASVCEKDAICCTTEWDDICASEAARDPYCSCSK